MSHCYSVAEDSWIGLLNNSNDDDNVNNNDCHWENLFLVRCFIFDVTILTTSKGDDFKDPYITDEDTGARIG